MADQPLDPPRTAPPAALAQAMAADGVDLTDEAAVTAWLDEFDDRPFAERVRVFVEWLPPLPPLSLPTTRRWPPWPGRRGRWLR